MSMDGMERRTKNCPYRNPDCQACNGPDLWTTRPDSREFDPDVISRAAHNADAPYDQRTCENYPWAAAARIRFLEQAQRPTNDLLLCSYCRTWHSKPCGEGCYWSPADPTFEKVREDAAAQRSHKEKAQPHD